MNILCRNSTIAARCFRPTAGRNKRSRDENSERNREMLVITSNGKIAKANSSLVGRSVIAVFAEPDDRIGELSDVMNASISPRIAPSASLEQMLSALDLLRKHLLHEQSARMVA